MAEKFSKHLSLAKHCKISLALTFSIFKRPELSLVNIPGVSEFYLDFLISEDPKASVIWKLVRVW